MYADTFPPSGFRADGILNTRQPPLFLSLVDHARTSVCRTVLRYQLAVVLVQVLEPISTQAPFSRFAAFYLSQRGVEYLQPQIAGYWKLKAKVILHVCNKHHLTNAHGSKTLCRVHVVGLGSSFWKLNEAWSFFAKFPPGQITSKHRKSQVYYSRDKNSGPFMMLRKPLFFWMLKILKITNIITSCWTE